MSPSARWLAPGIVAPPGLADFGLGRLTDDARNQGLHALSYEVLDLNTKDFRRIHLEVEKLNDPSQFRGDYVSDKQHTNLARLEVRFHGPPELFRILIVPQELLKAIIRCNVIVIALSREFGNELLDRPVDDGIRRVVEHLTDDFPPDAGIGASLDFDERRYGVMVEKQVVERPTSRTKFLFRYTHFSTDEEPTSGIIAVDLISGQQIRILFQERLEHVLRLEGLFVHFDQRAIVLNVENLAVHLFDRLGSAIQKGLESAHGFKVFVPSAEACDDFHRRAESS